MSYRVLALPNLKVMSLEVARKLRELVTAGAVVVGPKPERCTGRQDDAELKRIANELWDGGKITTRSAKEAVGVPPDVEGIPDWIHRRVGDVDVYFVSNQKPEPFSGKCVFRVTGTKPELWDPVTGTRENVPVVSAAGGRTTVLLELPAYGSAFIVFGGRGARQSGKWKTVAELGGPWEVSFDGKTLTFEKLVDWTTVPEVRYFSGSAVYRKTFEAPKSTGRLFVDLGGVSMLAEVRLNGKNLGVVWCPPWRVEITDAVKASGNVLEVTVVNGWYNQLVGDPEKERTKTNIRLKPGAQPQESGLLGPVKLLVKE